MDDQSVEYLTVAVVGKHKVHRVECVTSKRKERRKAKEKTRQETRRESKLNAGLLPVVRVLRLQPN